MLGIRPSVNGIVTLKRPRYLVGAFGGLVLIGSSILGLHAVQVTGPLARASVTGSFPKTCAMRAVVTTCSVADTRPAGASAAASAPASPYRDGTFAVTGHYETPGGSETIGVSLTVAAGVVHDATVTVEATSPTARQFQEQFATRYASQVVARNLADVKVSRVAGASLTSVGFNRAVAEIQAAARA